MNNQGLTLTVIANMTSNYGEGLGNISSVQKVFRNGKTYATRSRESLKNALMVQSGFYNDLTVTVDGAAQKEVTKDINAGNCRALEGGYMNTSNITNIRKSSFYLTDAVSCSEFVNETRFHNNMYLASKYAKDNGLNLQVGEDAGKSGLMPYQYEFDKSLKQYSLTIDLDCIGIDENFEAEANQTEKADRVITILDTVEHLSLVVKGNLDNAEPIFIVGGIGKAKTHYFENVVQTEGRNLVLTPDLKDRIKQDYGVALLQGGTFSNENAIMEELKPLSVSAFFEGLRGKVKSYYGV